MAKTPNYNHERRERERLKAAKKAEKAEAKAAIKAAERDKTTAAAPKHEEQA